MHKVQVQRGTKMTRLYQEMRKHTVKRRMQPGFASELAVIGALAVFVCGFIAPDVPAMAQTASSSAKVEWSPAAFTRPAQGEPEWVLLNPTLPGERCYLDWTYSRGYHIVISRELPGSMYPLRMNLWTQGSRVGDTTAFSAEVSIDGQTFRAVVRESPFNPIAHHHAMNGGTVEFFLEEKFLDAFERGDQMTIRTNQATSRPIALHASKEAVRAFKACRDIPAQAGVVGMPPGPTASLVRLVTPRSHEIWGQKIYNDMPAQARRERMSGAVKMHLLVNDQGRVAQCDVVGSSGYAILDQAACDGMKRWSQFNPALDSRGRPTHGTYRFEFEY